jgi:hypothetical protein
VCFPPHAAGDVDDTQTSMPQVGMPSRIVVS